VHARFLDAQNAQEATAAAAAAAVVERMRRGMPDKECM
jgi:hypothetical protein